MFFLTIVEVDGIGLFLCNQGLFMKIVLVAPFSSPIPPKTYGGTQRDVYWLAKALSNKGHKVYVLAPKGSYVNEKVTIIPVPKDISNREIHQFLPADFDIVNFHNKLNYEPDFPYLHSLHGNAKIDEWLPQNTSFISHKHALNHGGKHFVYNGLDLDEYPFEPNPDDYFSFLGKITWKRKNLRKAKRVARKAGVKLKIGGGWRLSLDPKVQYMGMVGGENKVRLLKNARGMIFPTAWEEPMGLVVVESMACGTPCIVSNRGAMPELVNNDTGFICENHDDYIAAIRSINDMNREDCRERVKVHFCKEAMAEGYLTLFRKILDDPTHSLQPELDINATMNSGNLVDIKHTPAEKLFNGIKAKLKI